jgi:predicted site-specific integrase-resolvase
MREAKPTHPHFFTTLGVARALNVSSETVRVWERRGQIRALKTESGQRIFEAEEVAAVKAAREAKRRVG